MGHRAYIYLFNDDDEPKLHGASGLTRKFEPKPSFHAVAHLYQTLGDYRFARVVHHEAAKASVYEFVHGSDPKKVIWAAWSPTGTNQLSTLTLDLEELDPQYSESMPVTSGIAPRTTLTAGDKLTIEISESPLYLFFTRR